MVSLAAEAAPASLGVCETFGSPLSSARSVQPAAVANAGANKIVALFEKKPAAPAPKTKPAAVSPANEELAKWYDTKLTSSFMHGGQCSVLLASSNPEAFNKFGANCGPEAVWFKTGALLLDGNTLNCFGKNIPINLIIAVVAEIVLVGGFGGQASPRRPIRPLGARKRS